VLGAGLKASARLIAPKILGWSLAATSMHVELASMDVADRENYLIDLWAKAIDGNGQPAQPRSSQPKRR
jgi:hypothetical protein